MPDEYMPEIGNQLNFFGNAKAVKPVKLNRRMRYEPSSHVLQNEENIKLDLITDVAKTIFKNGYFTLKKTKLADKSVAFYLRVDVMPIREYEFDMIAVKENNKITYNNIDFTEEEIINAIKNTYPERLL